MQQSTGHLQVKNVVCELVVDIVVVLCTRSDQCRSLYRFALLMCDLLSILQACVHPCVMDMCDGHVCRPTMFTLYNHKNVKHVHRTLCNELLVTCDLILPGNFSGLLTRTHYYSYSYIAEYLISFMHSMYPLVNADKTL